MKQIFSYILLIISLLPSNLFAQEVFRVGIIRYKSPEAFMETYEPLMNFLGKKLGKTVVLDTIPEDELAYKISDGQYDLGIFTPFPYLRAKIDFPELEVFASHTIDGGDSYSGCIVIRKESGINSLHELKKRNFLFVKPTSTSGYKYPKGIFKERNLDIDAGFFNYNFSGGHDRSLKALIDQEVDGIAIDTRVYNTLNDTKKDSYQMLECYEVPFHAYVMGPTMDSTTRQELKDIMFQAHKNPENKELFKNALHLEKWHPQSDDAYNSLRRYLRIVRVKPTLQVEWEIRSAAKKMLDKRGDVLDLLKEGSMNKLRSTQRFKAVSEMNPNGLMENSKVVKVTLATIDQELHYNFYFEDEQIGTGGLSEQNIVDELPTKLVQDVLNANVIETQLLFNGKDWFVTYGSDDGILPGEYEFEIHGESGSTLVSHEQISEITSLNTFFALPDDETIKEGQKVNIRFRRTEMLDGSSNSFDLGADGSFWDNLDNRWGVIGLLVAFISVVLGSYFSTRRKRRFGSYLKNANNLLLHFLVQKEGIDTDLLAQKDSIHTSLKKGKVTENQFLILNKRIEDIERIIHEDFPHHKKLDKNIKKELDEICSNGLITEKEFSRILILTRKQQGLGSNS